ncbi:hypothetical protein BDV12DRAFT_173545 [Aspergillus spectabilis]
MASLDNLRPMFTENNLTTMTSFRLIPLEIIDAIIPYLWEEVPESPPLRSWEVEKNPPSRGLARYATISQKWQFAIERYTFASLVTFSDDLFRLKRVVGNCSRRRSHVRELWFSIDLPLYSDSRRSCLERLEEHQANLAAFQQGVQDLWEELLRWNKECPPSGMKLVLNAEAPVDRGRENERALWHWRPERALGTCPTFSSPYSAQTSPITIDFRAWG